MTDYHEHIGDRVKVVDTEGEVFIGTIIGYDVGIMEDLDYDSIDIQTGEGFCISVPIPDIVSCEVLKD
ncbi:hypothetical protein D3C76_275910 [compost metagenome]